MRLGEGRVRGVRPGTDEARQPVLAAQVVVLPDRALPPAVPGGERVVHLVGAGEPAAADVDPAGAVERHPFEDALHVPHAQAYRGAMRIAPSRRRTAPLSISFSMMCWARAAYSSGRPRRGGNGACCPSETRTGSGRLASIGVSKIPGAIATTRMPYLASSRAAYITGDEVTVDGGFTRNVMGLIPRPGYDALGSAR